MDNIPMGAISENLRNHLPRDLCKWNSLPIHIHGKSDTCSEYNTSYLRYGDWPHNLWEIYSLRSNSWTKLDIDMPKVDCSSETCLYLDGKCHWLGSKVGDPDIYETREMFLASFDLSNDVFFTTFVPKDIPLDIDDFDSTFVQNQLVLLNGSIAIISTYSGTTRFQILVLGQLGAKESWTKLFIGWPLLDVGYFMGIGKKGMIDELGVQSKDGSR
ncbi:hypothetical protein CR513_51162, partial [Mucuna pruriens]